MPSNEQTLSGALGVLANRDSSRTEATVQSNVHLFLTLAPLDLGDEDLNEIVLESPVGDRRRIDIEVGSTVIEVKRDLRSQTISEDAVTQLAGYIEHRVAETGGRYVGIITDGCEWRAYHLVGNELTEVAVFELDPQSPSREGLIGWLDGVMATREQVPPTRFEIERLLGANSSGHHLELADLRMLYEANKHRPEIAVKRELWEKLLRTALGTQFRADDDELFVEHTLLVATAEAVAHAVVGIDVTEISATSILGGEHFSRRAQIFGVVEQDFFDWPVECAAAGQRWVKALAKRLARFAWQDTEHDVMKTIYESVITAETRRELGEYYTPDFLAEHMVAESIDDPLAVRVLDPSCGSGTFLFHAVRRYRDAALAEGQSTVEVIDGLTRHVFGIDLHPVAATLARVTYLLGIGTELLQAEDRPALRVPVFVGDSLQWGQREDLFSNESLTVHTDDDLQFFADELTFPDELLDDADRFDQLVIELANAASGRDRGSPHPSIGPIARRHGLSGPTLDTVTATFGVMCRLHDEARDHVWSYFIRNLARPAWLARSSNQVDVLIGNPPWLVYRSMSEKMQERYREFATDRGMWAGGSVASQQDLSDIFVARVVEQYLRVGGRFSFVMPAGVLTRGQYSGFRTGDWSTPRGTVDVALEPSWDLSAVYPYFFPRTCCVIAGTRVSSQGEIGPMPTEIEAWRGSIPDTSAPWATVDGHLERGPGAVVPHGTEVVVSPYAERFANGATIFPRVLTTVVRRTATSTLGTGAGRVAIESHRGTYEKKPWKNIETMTGVVESEFLYPLMLGENVLPFLMLDLSMTVLPMTSAGQRRDPAEAPGLDDWWQRASTHWMQHRTSELSLLDNLDYRRKLTNQLPPAPHRVAVTHSGMHVTACRVSDPDAIVEHQLDWAACRSEDEALYLCAVLNSPVTTEFVTPHMTSGKGGGRHIGKSLWNAPIPLFDPTDEHHRGLAERARACEELVAAEQWPAQTHGALRRRVREFLAGEIAMAEINELVKALFERSSVGTP